MAFTIIIAIASLLFGVSAQSVEFQNSINLVRPDGWTCMSGFQHDDYLFSSCSSYNVGGDIVHEMQVWDCNALPCIPLVATPLGDDSTPVQMNNYERIDAGHFRFTAETNVTVIIECIVSKNIEASFIGFNGINCNVIFDLTELRSTFDYLNIVGMSTYNDTGDMRVIATRQAGMTPSLIHIDCLYDNYTCYTIAVNDVSSFYPGLTSTYTAKVANAGSITFFSDVEYLTGRGAIIKLECDPVDTTLGVNDPNCTFISISMIDDCPPYSFLGIEMVIKAFGNEVTVLSSATDWVNPNGYMSGAIASFFCSDQFGPGYKCTEYEVNLHQGPSGNCLYGTCYYGMRNTITTSLNGNYFAVGVPLANILLGQIRTFVCEDLPMVLCSHAGDFRPNAPPVSDGYGYNAHYNSQGSRVSITSGYIGVYYGDHHLWTVDTVFNTTIPTNYSPTPATYKKIKEIMSKKGKMMDAEQENTFICMHEDRILESLKKHGLYNMIDNVNCAV